MAEITRKELILALIGAGPNPRQTFILLRAEGPLGQVDLGHQSRHFFRRFHELQLFPPLVLVFPVRFDLCFQFVPPPGFLIDDPLSGHNHFAGLVQLRVQLGNLAVQLFQPAVHLEQFYVPGLQVQQFDQIRMHDSP